MRCGADDLHAAGVSLVVWLGSREARQEAVVDVDAPSCQLRCELGRQHLHVAGEHKQFGTGGCHDLAEFPLLR